MRVKTRTPDMLTTNTMQVLPNQGYSVLVEPIRWLVGPDWWLPSGAHQADHQCHQVPPAARTPEKVLRSALLHSSTLLWTILFYLVHGVHHASNFGLCNTCSAVPVLICNNLTSQHCLPRHRRSSHQSTLCMKSIALMCMQYVLHCVYVISDALHPCELQCLMYCSVCNIWCIVVQANFNQCCLRTAPYGQGQTKIWGHIARVYCWKSGLINWCQILL